MKREIGFGIVGAGLIAPFHLNAIRDCGDGRAVGIYDIRPDRAGKVAEEFAIKAFDSLETMLGDDDIDVICVATPNHLHRDAVVKSAGAGKHVLTEKPPAMSLAETDEMISACEQNGVRFGCFVQCRLRAAVRAMKQAVETGRFGRLLRADAYMKWHRGPEYYSSDPWRSSRRSGSGVCVAQGFHYIDLLHYLAGRVSELEARMTNINHPGVKLEDDAVAVARFENGARGLIQLSTALWPGRDIRIELNGTEGAAVMTGERIALWKFRKEQPEDEQIRMIGNAKQETGAAGAAAFGYHDHMIVIRDMIEALRKNKDIATPVTSVRHSLEIVLALYQSAARGRPAVFPVRDDESVWDADLE